MFTTYHEVFKATVESHQGQLVDQLDQQGASLVSAYFPVSRTPIRRGDEIALGLALFQDEADGPVSLQAFSYRLICTNGMMRISVMQKPEVIASPEDLPGKMLHHLDPALHQPRLEREAEDFRRLQEMPVSTGDAQQLLRRFHQRLGPRWLSRFLGRSGRNNRMGQEERIIQRRSLLDTLRQEIQQNQPLREDAPTAREITAFDLVNTVTAIARDNRDPQEKRRLMVHAGEMMDMYLAYATPDSVQAQAVAKLTGTPQEKENVLG